MQDCRCRGAHGGEQQRVQADSIRQCSGFGTLSFWYLSPPASLCAELAGSVTFFPAAVAHVLVHSSRLAQGGVVVVVALLLPSLELLTVDRVASR